MVPCWLAELLEQLDWEPPELDEPVIPGLFPPKRTETFGPIAAPKPVVVLDELLELVEQPPFAPLTLEEELGVCTVDELLLQLYAFATWKFVVGIAIIAVIAIIAPNARVRLCMISVWLPTIKEYSEDCYIGRIRDLCF
jgi:hypothetical protein